METIIQQKALEAYPIKIRHAMDSNRNHRNGYVNGYKQAMQDVFEYLKYCSTLTDMNGNTRIDNDLLDILIEQFKNYWQNESEN